MSWFGKAVRGNVSLMSGTKHVPEGSVLPFTDEERSHNDSLLMEKHGFIKFFKTAKEASDFEFTPMSKLEDGYQRVDFNSTIQGKEPVKVEEKPKPENKPDENRTIINQSDEENDLTSKETETSDSPKEDSKQTTTKKK